MKKKRIIVNGMQIPNKGDSFDLLNGGSGVFEGKTGPISRVNINGEVMYIMPKDLWIQMDQERGFYNVDDEY